MTHALVQAIAPATQTTSSIIGTATTLVSTITHNDPPLVGQIVSSTGSSTVRTVTNVTRSLIGTTTGAVVKTLPPTTQPAAHTLSGTGASGVSPGTLANRAGTVITSSTPPPTIPADVSSGSTPGPALAGASASRLRVLSEGITVITNAGPASTLVTPYTLLPSSAPTLTSLLNRVHRLPVQPTGNPSRPVPPPQRVPLTGGGDAAAGGAPGLTFFLFAAVLASMALALTATSRRLRLTRERGVRPAFVLLLDRPG